MTDIPLKDRGINAGEEWPIDEPDSYSVAGKKDYWDKSVEV